MLNTSRDTAVRNEEAPCAGDFPFGGRIADSSTPNIGLEKLQDNFHGVYNDRIAGSLG